MNNINYNFNVKTKEDPQINLNCIWVSKIRCIGNENVYHILEPKAEDDEDKAAPYKVPVLIKTKIKTQ